MLVTITERGEHLIQRTVENIIRELKDGMIILSRESVELDGYLENAVERISNLPGFGVRIFSDTITIKRIALES